MIQLVERYQCSLCQELFREEGAATNHAAICDFDDYATKSMILGQDYAAWVAALEKVDALTRIQEEVELAYTVLIYKQGVETVTQNEEAPAVNRGG